MQNSFRPTPEGRGVLRPGSAVGDYVRRASGADFTSGSIETGPGYSYAHMLILIPGGSGGALPGMPLGPVYTFSAAAIPCRSSVCARVGRPSRMRSLSSRNEKT